MKKIVITETQLKKIIEQNKKDNTYFSSFSKAVGEARLNAESKGYEIDEDDWWKEIAMGQGKPKDGKTTKASIGLIKNGKPQKKSLHIQVYNMGDEYKKNYELNFYIS